MRKSIFTKSIRILIVTLLLLAVFFQREKSQLLMALTCLLWMAVVLGNLLWKPAARLIKKGCRLLKALLFDCPIEENTMPRLETIRTEPKKSFPLEEKDEKLMLHHIALRVTDKIKSAYPGATWQWKEAPALSRILAGNTIRIAVENMDDYTHADVSFDRYARIHIEPMTIGSFSASVSDTEPDDPETEVDTLKEPPVVDVTVWYQLIGQKVLDTVITELNANGHTKLSIKENGDIIITRQKKECIQDTLDSFPNKNYWEELIALLDDYDLQGKIADDKLTISWV